MSTITTVGALILGGGVLLALGSKKGTKDPASKLPTGKNPLPPKPKPDPVVEPENLTPYDFDIYTSSSGCPGPGCYPVGDRRGTFRIDYTTTPVGVRWRVFGPIAWHPYLNNWGELTNPDAVPLGTGYGTDEDEARVAGRAFVDALPNKNYQGQGESMPSPSPMPPKPSPMPPEPPSAARHGLAVDGDRITVVDPVQWVAWAAPRLAEQAKSLKPADAVGAVFAEGWPDQAFTLERLEIGGRPAVTAIDSIGSVLEAVRMGQAFPVTDPMAPLPLEAAAARLVGVDLGRHAPPAFAWRGWVIRLQPTPGGWRWSRWAPGAAQPSARGRAPTVTLAMQRAKQSAEVP